ncbi:Bloom syndrome [Mycena chlorophos]|uniref:DNA 3'-5' helicase n=1 Tax=Mycena chlorophos TaxID=658473 RepID=A0A8H6RZ06_MYCCL|nr:Bloom syndrome [Mycena chlorophos]
MNAMHLARKTPCRCKYARQDASQEIEAMSRDNYPDYVLMPSIVFVDENSPIRVRNAAGLPLKNAISARESGRVGIVYTDDAIGPAELIVYMSDTPRVDLISTLFKTAGRLWAVRAVPLPQQLDLGEALASSFNYDLYGVRLHHFDGKRDASVLQQGGLCLLLPAVAVQDTTLLYADTPQAVFSSPEMCLKHLGFRKWLKSDTAIDSFSGSILDEAHCIPQWSAEFRKLYGQLDALRSLFPLNSPFQAVSATLTPDDVYTVAHTLKIDLSDAYFINLGNDRPNITPAVVHMKSSEDFAALDALLPAQEDVHTANDIPKTLIFTNSIKLTHRIVSYLRRHYGSRFDDAFAPYHAHRSPLAKELVMDDFDRGITRALGATEAAGMGQRHARRRASNPIWVPENPLDVDSACRSGWAIAGHPGARHTAGRGERVQAPPKRRSRADGSGSEESEADSAASGDESEREMEWGKKVDDSLRDARPRDVVDAMLLTKPTGPCCDVCTNNAPAPISDDDSELNANSRLFTPEPNPSPSYSAHSTPSKHTNENGKRPMRPGRWASNAPWPVAAVCAFPARKSSPPSCVQRGVPRYLVLRCDNHPGLGGDDVGIERIKTIVDIDEHITKPPWALADDHGAEALALAVLDCDHRESLAREALARRTAKKQRTAEANAQKKAEKQMAKEKLLEKERKAREKQLEKERREQTRALARRGLDAFGKSIQHRTRYANTQ